jgi:hypothetical protein
MVKIGARAGELPEVGSALVDSVEDQRNAVGDLAGSSSLSPAASPVSFWAPPSWCWSVLFHVRPPVRR